MQINVIDVGTPATNTSANGRSYQSIEVAYKGENGQVSSKKLMSFANPDVFKTAQTWQKGDVVNVDTQKDDNGYWQWKAILSEGQAPATPKPVATSRVAPSTGTNKVVGSNYPTKDERANTQVYIVRQSSLTNAVNTLALNKEGGGATAEQVMELAEQYVDFVMNGKPKEVKPEVEASDLPI